MSLDQTREYLVEWGKVIGSKSVPVKKAKIDRNLLIEVGRSVRRLIAKNDPWAEVIEHLYACYMTVSEASDALDMDLDEFIRIEELAVVSIDGMLDTYTESKKASPLRDVKLEFLPQTITSLIMKLSPTELTKMGILVQDRLARSQQLNQESIYWLGKWGQWKVGGCDGRMVFDEMNAYPSSSAIADFNATETGNSKNPMTEKRVKEYNGKFGAELSLDSQANFAPITGGNPTRNSSGSKPLTRTGVSLNHLKTLDDALVSRMQKKRYDKAVIFFSNKGLSLSELEKKTGIKPQTMQDAKKAAIRIAFELFDTPEV